MTTIAKITIALLMALLFSSCAFDMNFGNGTAGNGIITEESRTITEEFTEVSASEGLNVYVTQAEEFNIEIEADENIIDLIGTDIKNGKLRIHAIENIGRATKKVYVSMPDITALKSSSGANLTATNNIQADKLSLNSSSGSNLTVEANATEISLDGSSGANVKLSGETNVLYIDGSSGANLKAGELIARTCDADASSGGNVTVNVSESLTADASSGGNIRYSGSPNVKTKKSVSGSVHKY